MTINVTGTVTIDTATGRPQRLNRRAGHRLRRRPANHRHHERAHHVRVHRALTRRGRPGRFTTRRGRARLVGQSGPVLNRIQR